MIYIILESWRTIWSLLSGIRKICTEILDDYKVEYCYLFGLYAKGNANERSDVDLLISTKTTGLRFYEIAE